MEEKNQKRADESVADSSAANIFAMNMMTVMGRPIGLDYVVSLPERVVRSAASLLGGTSLVLTETLLPDSLKETTTYRVTFGDFQKFLIARIGQVQEEGLLSGGLVEERILSDDYVRQKLAGGVLETAGLLTIRFSPVWVFAIAGDAAGGSKVFLNRLVEHLKRNEVIDKGVNPQSLTALLDAVQRASYKSAEAIDTPPLSQAELSALADDLADSYGRIFAKSQTVLPQFESIQSRMESVAEQENSSVEEVSGAMALDLASLSKAGVGITTAAGQAGSELIGERILTSYTKTLDGINQEGLGNYLDRLMTPFLRAAANHLDPAKKTWTEGQLLGRA